jgi:hypothetical protein
MDKALVAREQGVGVCASDPDAWVGDNEAVGAPAANEPAELGSRDTSGYRISAVVLSGRLG